MKKYKEITQSFPLTLEIDSGFYTVKFDSLLLKDAVVEADGVIPPLREDDPLSSESDSDDIGDGDDAVGYAKGVFLHFVRKNKSATTSENIIFKSTCQ